VDEDATEEEIRSAFRKLAFRFHEDKNRDKPKPYRTLMKALWDHVQWAYSILIDPETRLMFDETGKVPDENKSNKIYQAANENILMMIMNTFKDPKFRDNYDEIDLIASCVKTVNMNIGKAEEAIENFEDSIEYFEDLREMITHKGQKENMVTNMLKLEIKALEELLEKTEDELRVFNLMLQLLPDWEYAWERPENQFMFVSIDNQLGGGPTNSFNPYNSTNTS